MEINLLSNETEQALVGGILTKIGAYLERYGAYIQLYGKRYN